jgi:branched-chain amino acid transport system substrate-binding protein
MLDQRVRVIVGLMLAVISLAASGCGSSSTSGATSSSAAAKPSGTPIVFGSLCDCTGPDASSTGGYGPGVVVWAQWTNAHGGIDGHPVTLIQADDQADPSKALSAANQFVAGNAAAVTSGTANDPVIAPVLPGHKVPALGGFESSAPDGANPFFFPTGTTPAAQGPGIMRAGRLLGATKVGIPYCTEVASCKQTFPLLKAGAQQAGLAWVWQGAVSGSQPDYSAACLAA